MTLILGLVCREGIVVLADSQETFVRAGVKSTTQKLFRLGPSIVWGGSGDTGMVRALSQSLGKIEKGQAGTLLRPIDELGTRLHSTVNAVQKAQAEMTIQIPGLRKPPPTLHAMFCGMSKDGSAWILDVEEDGACDQHQQRGVCAIGSGEPFARFAYASLRHLSIRERSLDEALFIGYDIMDNAIATAAYGLARPIHA